MFVCLAQLVDTMVYCTRIQGQLNMNSLNLNLLKYYQIVINLCRLINAILSYFHCYIFLQDSDCENSVKNVSYWLGNTFVGKIYQFYPSLFCFMTLFIKRISIIQTYIQTLTNKDQLHIKYYRILFLSKNKRKLKTGYFLWAHTKLHQNFYKKKFG